MPNTHHPRHGTLAAAMVIAGLALTPAQAEPTPATSHYDAAARRLDEQRAQLFAPLGATTYSFDKRRLQSQPGGESRSLGSTLLQAPGVTPGTAGQIRIRGQ